MSMSGSDRLLYGLGGSVYAVKEAAYVVFVLLFYTQVLGLPGAITGVVLFVGLLWDAISDPLIGIWSDRVRSREGKRWSFMLAGAIPLGIGFVGLFSPPQDLIGNHGLLAGWLLFWSLWVRTAVTLFSIPHLALVAEVSSDYHERSRLLGYRMGFMFLTTVLLPAGAMALIFGVTGDEDGRFVRDNYPYYGWLSCIVVWLAAAGSLAGSRRLEKARVSKHLGQPGLRGMFKDFIGTLSVRNFRYLIFYDLAASASYGVLMALNIMAWTFYWELSSLEVSIVLAGPSLLAVPLGVWMLGPVGRRWSKHQIMSWAMAFMIVDAIWIYLLRIYDLIPDNGHPLVFALLFLQMFVWMFLFVFRVVAAMSITADITDEHELNSGSRQEGGFFSALTFTSKLASAFGPLYGGFALQAIGLHEGMMPGEIPQTTLDGLVIAMAVGMIPTMLLAWWFSTRVSMSEHDLQKIQQGLDES